MNEDYKVIFYLESKKRPIFQQFKEVRYTIVEDFSLLDHSGSLKCLSEALYFCFFLKDFSHQDHFGSLKWFLEAQYYLFVEDLLHLGHSGCLLLLNLFAYLFNCFLISFYHSLSSFLFVLLISVSFLPYYFLRIVFVFSFYSMVCPFYLTLIYIYISFNHLVSV